VLKKKGLITLVIERIPEKATDYVENGKGGGGVLHMSQS